MSWKSFAVLVLGWICMAANLPAQEREFLIQKSRLPAPVRSYIPPAIPPVNLRNSELLHSLIRAGNLYLTVHDALALAIENNLDLEIDRYGPLLAETALQRAKAGGPIRGVPSASAQVASVNSGVGVNGSVLSAGLSNGRQGGAASNGGAASIQQVGAITPNLDPVLQSTMTFAHLSQPQANTIVSQTTALIQSIHTYNTVFQQGLLTGGLVQYRDYEQYLKENSPTDILNPAMGPHMDLFLQHNLLQGFGVKLNGRGIRIARINAVASRETFRSQLLDLAASVLNLYWSLVSANDELRVRQQAFASTQKFYEDTQREVAAGAMPRVQLPRAQAEAATRRQDVIIAQQNVSQQAALVKQAITRVLDPEVEAAEIIPLDSIQIPETDNLPPLQQLVAAAMQKRPDVIASRFRDETARIALIGTENPLLPTLQVQAQTYNRGVSGTPQVMNGEGPNSYFIGGYGSAVKQIFRRNFPNNQMGVNFSAPLNNRQAQGDYGIDQLQYRQSQVRSQRDLNQIVVDISNQVSALRQSRARYAAARDTRMLQEQLLESDRKKFSYGIATFNDIVIDQRTLAAAQISEVNALGDYARARVSLDQVLGETLERNHITLGEGLNAHVPAQSLAPQSDHQVR
jgi:outer membrane protein